MLKGIPMDEQDGVKNEYGGDEGDETLEMDDDDFVSDEEAIDSERIERVVVRYFRANPPATPDDITKAIEGHFMQMEVEEIVAEARRENWDNVEEAQELMFQAAALSLDDDAVEIMELTHRALMLDPDNADAGSLLATHASEDFDEIEARLRDVVARAERALGSDIEEGEGALWINALARPYMRARYTLMTTLTHAHKWHEAIVEARALLELNEDDDQSVASALLALYLASGDTQSARAVMKQYCTERSAIYEWASVLEKLLSGNKNGAKKALDKAMRNNPYVAEYLFDLETVVEAGSRVDASAIIEEAYACALELACAWAAHPEALEWLQAAIAKD